VLTGHAGAFAPDTVQRPVTPRDLPDLRHVSSFKQAPLDRNGQETVLRADTDRPDVQV
jgi:hypothetical protein